MFDNGFAVLLHKDAYLGQLKGFKDRITTDFLESYKNSIRICILRGCNRNFEFAQFCFKEIPFDDQVYFSSIFCKFLYHGIFVKEAEFDDNVYSLLGDPMPKESVLLLLNENVDGNRKIDDLVVYLSVLNEYEDIFKMVKDPYANSYTSNLIRSLNYPNYFHSSEFEFHSKPTRTYPEYYEVASSTFDDLLVFDNPSTYGPAIPLRMTEGSLLHFTLLGNQFLEIREYNPDEILFNIEDAYNAYLKNEHLDLVFSKFFTECPLQFFEEIESRGFFLEFCNKPINLGMMDNCSVKYAVFILYTNVFCHISFDPAYYEKIPFVEKTILELARKKCYYFVLKHLEKVYENTKKYVQVLNFEEKRYIFKELEEEPIFSPVV